MELGSKTVFEPIIQTFKDVFQPVLGLPPKRIHDHPITLNKETNPINVRPQPSNPKNEIERLVEDILKASIIQSSTTPFTNLDILVKKDDSCRFYVDHRALNKARLITKSE